MFEKFKKVTHFSPGARLTTTILATVLFVGVVLRFVAMLRGHNFDFESYTIVGDIVLGGGNVYAETVRYNYGPVWFLILGLFRGIGQLFQNPDLFRILIVALLTFADIAIALLLRKKFGLLAFALFFLNPISIIITGYHNQFDNLALLVGMCGLLLLPPDTAKKIERRHVYAALLIGLSLMIKHIFFLLPLWLFIRGTTWRIKLFMLVIPVAIFAFSFLPFWFNDQDGIIQNVFTYKSFANAPLINAFFAKHILVLINPTFLMIGALAITGFMTRKLPIFEASLWYLLVLVSFSPAVANQYLAIAAPATAAFGMLFFVPYMFFSTLLLGITSESGMHIFRFVDNIPPYLLELLVPTAKTGQLGQYRLIIVSLFAGVILAAIYRYRRHWFTNIKLAITEQIKSLRRP